MEKRLADLEAYVNNGARADDATSKIAAPGPGHNGFMMICAALVLFMTLPGLALFYGGLVRSKNVLSIMAQCMGIAGLVTLLWWAVGYSMTFAAGNPFLGGFEHGVPEGRRHGAEHHLRRLGVTEHLLDVPADVRDHHAGADRRRDRRAHEVQRAARCSSPAGCSSSTSRSPTWCGAATA